MAGLKDFGDLAGLRTALKEQERLREIEAAARAAREKKAREDAGVFTGAIKGVTKIAVSDRYVAPLRSAPVRPGGGAGGKPRTREDDDAAVLRESLSDQFDVEGLVEDDPSVAYARPGVGPDVVRKLRKRAWPVQDELDLHGMTRDIAREQVAGFLGRASRRGVRCVRIVHGRGYGSPNGEPVLRAMLHSWLVQMEKDEVVAFCVAGKKDGGHGALIVLLKAVLLD
ncbi:Smr/MutS family protein [Massilia sp. DWR3-1-1]|uniref:Smr/MutS family protein n=1 Tax=Massilia sp. DWR3-1-1 TaxID=2804559 RepID=UPI003CEBD793